MKWLMYGIFGGVALALVLNKALAADPTVISSTVTGTSSSNTVSSSTIKGAATASAPSVQITNSDICKYATANTGVQTQVFGISTGGVIVTDEHCMRLKSARAMNAVGLKTVAASILSTDATTFKAMWMSGVYPPIDGKLGNEARELWLGNPQLLPSPLTFKELLTSEDYNNWDQSRNPAPDDFVTERTNAEGEKECRATDGNYWSRC